MKTKTFDCVEMKRKCQEAVRQRYDSRHEEFASYIDFLNETIEENEWARETLRMLRGEKSEKGD